jgi:hypothetical protein
MPDPPSDPNYSFLDTPSLGDNPLAYFADILINEQTGRPVSSDTEVYLANPRTGLVRPEYTSVDLGSEVDIETFEKRFSLLWNTLWKASWAYSSIMGGELTNITIPASNPGGAVRDFDTTTLHHTTSQQVFPLPEVYVIDRAWLTIYFV